MPKPKRKIHLFRTFQLLGYTGILLVVPLFQFYIGEVNMELDKHHRLKIEANIQLQMCSMLENGATSDYCVIDDPERKREISSDAQYNYEPIKEDILETLCLIFGIFAFLTLTGKYLEYRHEYDLENSN
ncbi:hypothetical protein J8M20_23040 [Pseudoalteromonas luteoviolacea]|uniref:hypothetical protein n=1 Tax=Pseudoalteromonas luteoviolacea TaxID=43657 RepID=UPI001B392F37|nr:hypothetical protein [Pseudoalteromonas luteoviolacea]MBQ4814262.1 hypothetical protein [Pseudoalteromonas luteoviolacea]